MANVRKLYLHTDPDIGHVEGRSLTQRSDERPLTFVSKETVDIGLTLLTGGSDSLEVVQIGGTPELAFVIKRDGAQTGEALAICETFAWSSQEEAYVGTLILNTLQVRSVLAGKVDAVEHSGASHDLALADVAKLIAFTHSGDFTVNLKAQADVTWADGTTIAILNNSTRVLTLDPATSVNINGSTSNITIAAGDLYLLTRTAANTWTAAEAEEEDTVTVRGQWAYRDAESGGSFTYGPDIAVTIRDAYYRADESIPENTADPTAYVTDAELAAEVAGQIGTAADDAISDRVLASVVFPTAGSLDAIVVDGTDDIATITMGTMTVPANFLKVGDVIEFAAYGRCDEPLDRPVYAYVSVDGAVIGDNPPSAAMQNTVFSGGDTDVPFAVRGEIMVLAIGATGKLFCSIGIGGASGSFGHNLNTVTPTTNALVTVDTTGSFTLDIGLWNSTSASNLAEMRLHAGFIRKRI